MKLLSIDQSLAGCASVVLDEKGVPIFRGVIRTTSSKSPKHYQIAFDVLDEQMIYIADELWKIAVSFEVKHVVMESLSLGSLGDQTRNLAGLFHVIRTTFIRNGFPLENLHTIAPTSVKSWARDLLPVAEQTEGFKKDGKPKLTVMKKEHMVRAVETSCPEVLEGYKNSGEFSGRADLADAFLIGRFMLEKLEAK